MNSRTCALAVVLLLGCDAPESEPAVSVGIHEPEEPICAGCWDGEACHPSLPPEPDPCLVHACGDVVRCGVATSCGDCAADEACADAPVRICAKASCLGQLNGELCSVEPVRLGQCGLEACRCSDASACVLPPSCADVSCNFGVCVYEPAGCKGP